MPRRFHQLLRVGLVAFIATSASAQLTIIDTLPLGSGCGCAVDPGTEEIFIVRCAGPSMFVYNGDGDLVRSIPQPNAVVDNVDLEVVNTPFTLGGVAVSAGSLLFISGDYLTAQIYAMDPADGAVIATLTTAFGNSHVVGGAYHAGRGTLFLLQDQFASSLPDTVAEIDPDTGAILSLFALSHQDFTVWYGDIDTSAANGNLFIVSSMETAIAEYTTGGSFVQEHALPFAASTPSGLALIDGTGEAWISQHLSAARRLAGFPVAPCACELTVDDTVDVFDLLAYLDLWFEADAAAERTGDDPASIDVFDLLDYLDCWFAGC